MTSRTLVLTAVFAIGVVLFAGCSSTSATPLPTASQPASTTRATTGIGGAPTTAPTKTDAKADEAAAKAALLTVSDFPTGWTGTSQNDTSSAFDKCPSDKTTRIVLAEGPSFDDGGAASVSESIAVYHTADEARVGATKLSPLADCMAATINDGKLDQGGVKYSGAKSGPVSFPTIGDVTTAYRVSFTGKDSKSGVSISAYIDAVWIASGRSAFSIVAVDVLSPFDATQLTTITQKALAKLNGQSSIVSS